MRRIYLAARYSRILEIRQCANTLSALGFRITARWCYYHETDDDKAHAVGRTIWGQHAQRDYADICASDTIVCFTEPKDKPVIRGSRHVEFGIALERGMKLIVIGPEENIFYCLPQVKLYSTFEEFICNINSNRS